MFKRSFLNIFKIAFVFMVFFVGFSPSFYATNVNMDLSIASKILAVSENDLKHKLDEGKSLYSILKDKEKIEEFKETLLKEVKSTLEKDVNEGKLTKEKADEIYSLKESNILSWAEKEPSKLNR